MQLDFHRGLPGPPVDRPTAGKYKPADVATISELFDLAGRVAIVTGGSRGLGQEMAEGLAEAGGARFRAPRREEWLTPAVAALRARGFTVEGAICDVSRSSEVQAVVDRTMATYG